MRIGVIIQARMGSQRLPGKVLRWVGGRPLLEYLLERLDHGVGDLPRVVATSTEAADDAIADFCAARGVACHRGSMADVAGRFLSATEAFGFDAFVRLSADSPLLDQKLVAHGVGLFRAGHFDLVTNVALRSFPHGQSVEVVRTTSFARACAAMDEVGDREHVTRYFYRHPTDFSLHNFAADQDYSSLQLAVDTAADAERCAGLLARLERPHWQYGWRELLELIGPPAAPAASAAMAWSG